MFIRPKPPLASYDEDLDYFEYFCPCVMNSKKKTKRKVLPKQALCADIVSICIIIYIIHVCNISSRTLVFLNSTFLVDLNPHSRNFFT